MFNNFFKNLKIKYRNFIINEASKINNDDLDCLIDTFHNDKDELLNYSLYIIKNVLDKCLKCDSFVRCGISNIHTSVIHSDGIIERYLHINIFCRYPGLIIGHHGKDFNVIVKELEDIFGLKVKMFIR